MLLRDRLLSRLEELGPEPDYARVAREVLGIQNAPPALARRLVDQALVVEDRSEKWQAIGERICRNAPAAPGVYVLRDANDRVLYVGKALNLRRRLRAHFSPRRWKALKAPFARACQAEMIEVGSELEALLREAALIARLQPAVNIQTRPPSLEAREIRPALLRDVLVVVPSVDAASVELIGARVDGGWTIQRTRRDGTQLRAHASLLMRFFKTASRPGADESPLAPIVFSWLSHRGDTATRLDAGSFRAVAALRKTLVTLLADETLFTERIELARG